MFGCGFCCGVAIATGGYLICMLTILVVKEFSKRKVPECTCKGCPKYDEELGCGCECFRGE